MLKKIAADQLSLGMYVHRLCGSWLDHPFWKSAILLTDRRQLAQIRSSAVRKAWIDTTRGCDVSVVAAEKHSGESLIVLAPETDPERIARPPVPFDDLAACSLSEELARA